MRKDSMRPRATSTGKKSTAATSVRTRGRTRERRSREEDEAPPELVTELALGSDGLIYVNAEGMDPARYAGRKMFQGFAMTSEEAERAVMEIHRLAFNVTVSVQAGARRPRKTTKKKDEGA
jgi:hypothetical protein